MQKKDLLISSVRKKEKKRKKYNQGEYSAQSPGNVWKLPWGDTYYHG
jgi:hypothetical protein